MRPHSHPSLYVPLVYEEPFPLCSYASRPLIKERSLRHFAPTLPLYIFTHARQIAGWMRLEILKKDNPLDQTRFPQTNNT